MPAAPAAATTEPRSSWTVRHVAAATMVVAVVPYAVLKVLWLTGHPVGVPAGSLAAQSEFAAANAATLAMDVVALALAWVLLSSRGMRLPAAVILVPSWVGVGLLAPVVFAVPFVFAHTLVTTGQLVDMEDGLVDDWTYTTVYGSFFVQGIALAVLLMAYVRRRWGGTLRTLATPIRPATWFDHLIVTGAVALAVVAGGVQWFEAFATPSGWHNSDWTAANRFVTWVMGSAALAAAASVVVLAIGSGMNRWRPGAYVVAHAGSAVMFAYGLLNTFSTLADAPMSELTQVPERLLHFAAFWAGVFGAVWLGNLLIRAISTDRQSASGSW